MGGGGVGAGPAGAGQGQSRPPPAGGTVSCPQCGHINTPSNLFCGSCGFRLGGAAAAAPKAAPSAPAPIGGRGAGTVVLTALRADGTEAGTYALPGHDGHRRPRDRRHLRGRQLPLAAPRDVQADSGRSSPSRTRPRSTASTRSSFATSPSSSARTTCSASGRRSSSSSRSRPQPPSPDGVERLGSPAKGYVGRIALVIGREATGNAFPIPETGVHLGRERGDVLFPEDGYVSGLHCRLAGRAGVCS